MAHLTVESPRKRSHAAEEDNLSKLDRASAADDISAVEEGTPRAREIGMLKESAESTDIACEAVEIAQPLVTSPPPRRTAAKSSSGQLAQLMPLRYAPCCNERRRAAQCGARRRVAQRAAARRAAGSVTHTRACWPSSTAAPAAAHQMARPAHLWERSAERAR